MAKRKTLDHRPHVFAIDGRLKPEFRENSFLPEGHASIDLTFQRPIPILGRVLDTDGKAISGVEVTLTLCNYLDPTGMERRPEWRGLGVYAGTENYKLTPKQFTSKTDAEGRFELPFVPPDIFGTVWFEHPEFGTTMLAATTSDVKPVGAVGLDLKKSPIELRLPHTQKLLVQVKATDGKAIEGAMVLANPKQSPGISGNGTTDKDGNALLRLPAGKYELSAWPPIESEYLPTDHIPYTVEPEIADQSARLEIVPGSVVVFKVIDVETGKPLPGLSLWTVKDRDAAASGRKDAVSRQPGRLDEMPVTNSKGEYRAVLEPGKRQVGLYLPEGFTAVREDDATTGREMDFVAGKAVTVKFEVRQLADDGS